MTARTLAKTVVAIKDFKDRVESKYAEPRTWP
jgi:hypothetical protein